MIYLIKFFQVLAIFFLAFFWNKFILKKIQNLIISEDHKYTDDSYTSILENNKVAKITKYIQYLYWLVALVVAVLLVIQ